MSTDFNSNSRLHSDADFVDMFSLLSAQEQNKFWKEESESVFQNASLWTFLQSDISPCCRVFFSILVTVVKSQDQHSFVCVCVSHSLSITQSKLLCKKDEKHFGVAGWSLGFLEWLMEMLKVLTLWKENKVKWMTHIIMEKWDGPHSWLYTAEQRQNAKKWHRLWIRYLFWQGS